jgi:hypothetical protein
MASVANFPHRSRSNLVAKLYPDGTFTTGRSQPPKVDKQYKPLEGIEKSLDFRGAKVDQPVTVVRDSQGILKIFKQKNISVVTDIESVSVFETLEVDGKKVSKLIELIQGGKHLKGYYITNAGILVRPVTNVSVSARQPQHEADPSRLERIALDFEKAGNQEMADYFSDRYASEILSGKYALENGDRLVQIGDDLAVPPLGLSDATICHKSPPKNGIKPAKRGSKGITAHGRRRVRCACALLEQKYGKKCLSFLTATLPAFANADEFRLICSKWSYVVRAFIQELKRILVRRGYPVSMVWVTEIQEDRYQYSGEVAPHLHLVMIGKLHRFAKNWAIAKGEVRSLWERILSNLLGRIVTCQAATRVERPRKSLQGEFSSYLSKGGKMIEQIVKDGKADQLPSSYSGCSDNLKKAIDSRTEILKGKEAEDFIDSLEDMKQAGLLFYKPIIIYAKNLGKEITVGFVGWIKEPEIVTQFLAA